MQNGYIQGADEWRSARDFDLARLGGILAALLGTVALGIGVSVALGHSDAMVDQMFWVGTFGFGSVCLVVGAAAALVHWGIVVDRRRGTLTRWWGIIVPLRADEESIQACSQVTVQRELRPSKAESGPDVDIYVVYLTNGQNASNGGTHPVRVLEYRDPARAWRMAGELSKFLGYDPASPV